jgi:predicted dehydrogenase
MTTIRWGIIGCGDVTEVKSGPAFQKAAQSELVAVMRRNGDLARDYAQRHGVPRWHDDAEAILAAKDIDAVYIATRPDSHKEYVLRAAAAGKAVYVEKPMAMTSTECREMIAACETAGVPLFVAYYRRAMPYTQAIRRLLDDGRIGRPAAVQVYQAARLPETDGALPWRVDPAFGNGGLFFETACHTLDILDFLFGPVTATRGFAANVGGAYPPEDTVAAAFSFASGVLGSGTWCFASDHEDDWATVIGTRGNIRFHPLTFRPIRLETPDGVTEIPIAPPAHVQQPLIETIVAQLNGVGSCPSTGRTAVRTAAVAEEILKDYQPG